MAAKGHDLSRIAGPLALIGFAVVAYGAGYLTTPPMDHYPPAMQPIPAGGTEPLTALGPANAKVVVHELVDLRCRHCAQRNGLFKRLAAEHSADVLFELRFFPFVNYAPQRGAFDTEDGAIAAMAANRQGRFWEYVDLLYLERQSRWSPAVLDGLAEKLGLEVERFRRDMLDPALCAHVRRDKQAANEAQVTATPTLFVNGRKVALDATPEDIRRLVREARVSVNRILARGEARTVAEARALDAARQHPVGAKFAALYMNHRQSGPAPGQEHCFYVRQKSK